MSLRNSLLVTGLLLAVAGGSSARVPHATRAIPAWLPMGGSVTEAGVVSIDAGLPAELTAHLLGDGSLVTTRGLLFMRWRPNGLFVVDAAGRRRLIALPSERPTATEADDGSFDSIYPGVSERHFAGQDFAKREIRLGTALAGMELAEEDSLVVSWIVELENVGFLVRLPEEGGGLMIFDEEQTPALWLMSPFVLDRGGAATGDMPEFSARYTLDVVEGQAEISVSIALRALLGGGLDLPLVVDVTTLDLAE